MPFQLRIYRIQPGAMEQWIREWRAHVLPLRQAHGFDVVGPWVRSEEDLFVWLIGHADFDAANAAYYASPDRTTLDPDPARHIAEARTWMLERLEQHVDGDADPDHQ